MLIMVGGWVKDEWITTTELLDTINSCWYTCNNLPFLYRQMKAAIMNNKLYLLGGVGKDHKPSPQVFVASLETLSTHQLNWQSTTNTPWCFSAPVVLCNKLLTVGGRQPLDITSQTTEVCTFDQSTGHWKYLTNIPAARSFPAVVSVDDKMIVIGGMANKKKEYSNTVWVGMFE